MLATQDACTFHTAEVVTYLPFEDMLILLQNIKKLPVSLFVGKEEARNTLSQI